MFSKWFSEVNELFLGFCGRGPSLVANHVSMLQSGKLVTKMFQKIQQLIDDKNALVFVLIDEVKKTQIELSKVVMSAQEHKVYCMFSC